MNHLADEIAASLGKKMECEATGDEFELSAYLLGPIADSLIHLIRNAVDHGIELPAERLALGKPVTGRLSIAFSQTSHSILISIEDDGRGLDLALILQKAEQLYLLDRPAPDYSNSDIIELIFTPGFTTASRITSISGRGVGLDVVRSLIQSIDGQVFVDSILGRGTRFTLKIPR